GLLALAVSFSFARLMQLARCTGSTRTRPTDFQLSHGTLMSLAQPRKCALPSPRCANQQISQLRRCAGLTFLSYRVLTHRRSSIFALLRTSSANGRHLTIHSSRRHFVARLNSSVMSQPGFSESDLL